MRLRPSSIKKTDESQRAENAINAAVKTLAELIKNQPGPLAVDLDPIVASLQKSNIEIKSSLTELKQHVDDQLSKLPEGEKPTYHFEIKRNGTGLIQEVIATPEDSINEAPVNKNPKEILYKQEPK